MHVCSLVRLGFLAAVFVAPTVHAFADDAFWSVKADHAKCFLENIDAYLTSQDEPVVVFFQVCPIAERTAALQSLQKNSAGLPSGPTVRVLPGNTTSATVVVYSKSELACLKGMSITLDTSLVMLPKKP